MEDEHPISQKDVSLLQQGLVDNINTIYRTKVPGNDPGN